MSFELVLKIRDRLMQLNAARHHRMDGPGPESKVLRIDITYSSDELGAQLWRTLACGKGQYGG